MLNLVSGLKIPLGLHKSRKKLMPCKFCKEVGINATSCGCNQAIAYREGRAKSTPRTPKASKAPKEFTSKMPATNNKLKKMSVKAKNAGVSVGNYGLGGYGYNTG